MVNNAHPISKIFFDGDCGEGIRRHQGEEAVIETGKGGAESGAKRGKDWAVR
jgi:hypothetical protein